MQTREMLDDIYEKKIEDLDYYRKNYPTFFFNNIQKIVSHIAAARRQLLPIRRALIRGVDEWDKISRWWNRYVVDQQKAKRKNLYVWGPPNVGKSRNIVYPMMSMASAYVIMDDVQFWLPYYGEYRFAYCDEFHGSKPLEQLNQFMSEMPMVIRNFAGVTFKQEDIPVLLLSNSSPETLYPEGVPREAFLERFTVVHITQINAIF